MVQLVEEAIGWIEDRAWKGDPSFGPQRVELTIGDAMSVAPRIEDYRGNRRRAVQQLTGDIELELQALMRPKMN